MTLLQLQLFAQMAKLIVYNQSKVVCAWSYLHAVVRTNLCKNVGLWGYGRLRGSIAYFLATRFSQMNVEAANDVDQNIS